MQVWATFIGSHLTRERTSSPVLTKWWNRELKLATNFGNLCQTVTKVGTQNFGYQIWFCTRLLNNGNCHLTWTKLSAKLWQCSQPFVGCMLTLRDWKYIYYDKIAWRLRETTKALTVLWLTMYCIRMKITRSQSLWSVKRSQIKYFRQNHCYRYLFWKVLPVPTMIFTLPLSEHPHQSR